MRIRLLLCTLPLLSTACGGDKDDLGYDPALLEQYRSAIPKEERLTAATPETAPGNAVGDDPIYVQMAVPFAKGLNDIVRGIIATLDAITRLPPSIYNSDTQEFLWGPFPNDDGYGEVLVYIRKEPDGAEFEYSYAFVRRANEDVATWAPVIWGAATPDANDPTLGAGVTLFDWEANYQWEMAHVPGGPTETLDRGRFLTLYGKGVEGADSYAFNVAMFRDFIPKDGGTGGQAVDSDYFYGRYINGTESFTVDFFNWLAVADFCDANAGDPVCFDDASVTDEIDETLEVRLAAVNEGVGRAEASVSGGDLDTTAINAIECWDENVKRTFLQFSWTDGVTSGSAEEPASGTEALCGPIFENALDELNLPKIDTEDPDYIGMDCVASNGVGNPACE